MMFNTHLIVPAVGDSASTPSGSEHSGSERLAAEVVAAAGPWKKHSA